MVVKTLMTLRKTIVIILSVIVFNFACETEYTQRKSKVTESKIYQQKKVQFEKVTKDSIPCESGLTITPTKMNIFIIGIENPVEIKLINYPSDSVEVKISRGKIVKRGTGYYVIVNKPGKVSITVAVNGKIIGTKQFRCKYLLDPVVSIGKDIRNRRGGIMPKQQLVNMRIKATIINQDIQLNYRVVSHSVMGVINGKEIVAQGTGTKFSKAEKELISKIPKGRTVVINDIM